METVNKASNLAHEIVEKASNAPYQVANKIGEKGDQLKYVEQRLTEECSIYIRDNPLMSVGIAVGVGFIPSKLLSSR